MLAAAHLAAVLVRELPGTVRLGPLRFPVYGIFATAGLLSALAFSQRTARRAGVSALALWDAGIFAISAAFVVSRLLLVAENWATFRAMPLLVLALPSLTPTGILVTLGLTVLYLRRKRMDLRSAADAWLPPLCLLAGWLQVGHFFEGTDAGLPTGLPWAMVAPGDTILGRTHPVQLYAAAAALLLAGWLYRRRIGFPGQNAALGLGLGGAVSFLLDMLRQPRPDVWPGSETALPLDGSQIAAAAAVVAGAGFWLLRGHGAEDAARNTAEAVHGGPAPAHPVAEVR